MSENKWTWILEEARKDFAAGMNWMDFNNKYFGQGSQFNPAGNPNERKEWMDSPEYKEIQDMKYKLEEKQPEVTEPEYSGKILARVGKSLHRSLIEEADAEGMSLNQLVLAKLAPPLYDRVRGRR
jgi:hypothetical protein